MARTLEEDAVFLSTSEERAEAFFNNELAFVTEWN